MKNISLFLLLSSIIFFACKKDKIISMGPTACFTVDATEPLILRTLFSLTNARTLMFCHIGNLVTGSILQTQILHTHLIITEIIM